MSSFDVSQGQADLDGIKVAYWEYSPQERVGDDTVIISSGWPVNSSYLSLVAEKIAAAGVRVIRYDQRGVGESDKPFPLDAYGLPELAREFGAVIEATVPETEAVHAVGVSWGVFAASEYSRFNPTRISSLTSAGPPAIDLGFKSVARLTVDKAARAESNASLADVAKQWLGLSYFFVLSIPVLPDLVLSTKFPVESMNKQSIEIAEKIPGAKALIVKKSDATPGFKKYRWLVRRRILGGTREDYLNVPYLRVVQVLDDGLETDLLLNGLKERTPNLVLRGIHADRFNVRFEPAATEFANEALESVRQSRKQ